MGRAKVLFWLATAPAMLGTVLRVNADAWSRKITRSGPGWKSVTHHSTEHKEFYSTIGWSSIGLSIMLYGVVAHRWLRLEQPPASSPDAEPDAAGNPWESP